MDLHDLCSRSGGLGDPAAEDTRPPAFKAIGISLAVGSGLFIGSSFVLKKYGLLKANEKYNEIAGEGYGYLKNAWWWAGMTLMIVGEICNFVAYAFTDAILVTPLGALSVVLTTVLSAIFLKERLSMVGKVACFLCIVGSVVIVMNAPESSSVATIQEMQSYVVAPGFLTYTGVIIVGSVLTAIFAGPRWGNKNMLVYISICSWIGGLSVVATQGLGAAIVAQVRGTQQFNQPFLYILFVFVIATLLTEIVYLNKALNIFNAAMVTPTYYVYFTSTTIITSAVLFRGFKGTPASIVTVIFGFLTICAGVVLLQLSKSAKDVPDAAVFKGDLDQIHTIAEQEEPETEPRADAIRGTAAIVRRISTARQKREMNELKRLHEEKLLAQLEVVNEESPPTYEWDGLRRRRTTLTRVTTRSTGFASPPRSPHPPLGMTHFPTDDELERLSASPSLFTSITGSLRGRGRPRTAGQDDDVRGEKVRSPNHPVPLTDIVIGSGRLASAAQDTEYSGATGAAAAEYHLGLPPGLKASREQRGLIVPARLDSPWPASHGGGGSGANPTQTPPPPPVARRQFSFQNMFRWTHSSHSSRDEPTDGSAQQERNQSFRRPFPSPLLRPKATEEERLGLVTGDSPSLPAAPPPRYDEAEEVDDDEDRDEDDDGDEDKRVDCFSADTGQSRQHHHRGQSSSSAALSYSRQARPISETRPRTKSRVHREEKAEVENYELQRERWGDSSRSRTRGKSPPAS